MHLLYVCHQIKQQKNLHVLNVQLISGDNIRDSPQICAGPKVMKYCGLVIERGLNGIPSYSSPSSLKSMVKLVVVNCGRSGALRKPTLK